MTSHDPVPDGEPTVLVVAEHALVGESVRVALGELDIAIREQSWPSASRGAAPPECDRGLLITDLDGAQVILRARQVISATAVPWTVLTGAPRGPMWGAVLEVGASFVVPSSTSLGRLAVLLRDPAPRGEPGPAEREALVAAWQELWRNRSESAARLATLSPREHHVLRLLYRGEPVSQIAVREGLSPETVRSHVKALLRKLGVSSQLAAVAIYATERHRDSAQEEKRRPRAAAAPHPRRAVSREGALPNIRESAG